VAARPPVKIKGSGIEIHRSDLMRMKIKMKGMSRPLFWGVWRMWGNYIGYCL